MDIARLRLRELAAARWGGVVSPYFASMLHRTEAAIHELRQSTYAGVGTWPPASPTPPSVPRAVSRAAWRDDDPADAGVSALAQALAAGTFSVTDVVDALLARSSRLDPSLHVWATLDSAGARQRAGGRDEQIRSGAGLGPLMGVPIGVEDIINTDGLPTRANSRIAPSFATSEDAVALSWLVEAGAIVLGKT